MGIFAKSLLAIAKFIAVITVLNYLTPQLQHFVSSILLQDYIKDQDVDKKIIPFSGLMLIQKSFILLIASLAYMMRSSISKFIGIENASQKKTSNQNNKQSLTISQVPLKYQLLIGTSAFLSTQLFSEVQDSIRIQVITVSRGINVFLGFVIIHLWFINNSSLMKIQLSKSYLKIAYFIFKCCQFFYLVKCIHFVLFETFLWEFYYEQTYMQFIDFKFDFSFKKLAPLGLALLFQSAYYFCLCLLKVNKPKISTLQMLIAMMKFTAISFGIYALFNGELLDTIEYLISYPEGWGLMIKYCGLNFMIYLLLAWSIVQYPPSVFLAIMLSRGVFENLPKIIESNSLSNNFQIIGVVLAILALEVVKHQWFDEKQRLKDYNKIQGQRNDEITFTGDSLETQASQDQTKSIQLEEKSKTIMINETQNQNDRY